MVKGSKLTMEVTFDKGIYIPELDLWMDSTRKKSFCIVSHAHSDHVARHNTPVMSIDTYKLLEDYYRKSTPVILNYGEEVKYEKFSITLYPAGHCLGSSQIVINVHGTNETIVYTGDYKPNEGPVNVKSSVLECDTLILEATYGKQHYIFPDEKQIMDVASKSLNQWLESGYKPIVEGWKLGKSQEILFYLLDYGFDVVVEPSVYAICKVYESSGVVFPGNYRCFEGEWSPNEIFLCPPNRRKKLGLEGYPKKRIMRLTGWALDYQNSGSMLPYSDHADFNQLLGYVLESKAKVIYTVNGFPELAEYLRKLNYKAVHLSDSCSDSHDFHHWQQQMELGV
jgi:Cft2 family RNA processing exonuclease